jgi:hypothetical protein
MLKIPADAMRGLSSPKERFRWEIAISRLSSESCPVFADVPAN